jgi:hypothetical protein
MFKRDETLTFEAADAMKIAAVFLGRYLGM